MGMGRAGGMCKRPASTGTLQPSFFWSRDSLSFHLLRMFLGKTKTKPPERQRCEMGVGGLPWEPGVEMMSPLPGIWPWSTLPQASPPQFTQVNNNTTFISPGDITRIVINVL